MDSCPTSPPARATCGILVRLLLGRAKLALTACSEIFLPPYVDCDYEPLENRRDPVHDIILSDEESKSMLPQ